MPERSVSLLAEREYDAQKVDGLAIAVDDDIDRVAVWFDRSGWLEDASRDVIVTVDFWRSEDDGRTWLHAGTSSTHGGRIIGDGGNEYLVTKWSFDLPPGKSRQLRVDVLPHRSTHIKADVDLLIRSTDGVR